MQSAGGMGALGPERAAGKPLRAASLPQLRAHLSGRWAGGVAVLLGVTVVVATCEIAAGSAAGTAAAAHPPAAGTADAVSDIADNGSHLGGNKEGLGSTPALSASEISTKFLQATENGRIVSTPGTSSSPPAAPDSQHDALAERQQPLVADFSRLTSDHHRRHQYYDDAQLPRDSAGDEAQPQSPVPVALLESPSPLLPGNGVTFDAHDNTGTHDHQRTPGLRVRRKRTLTTNIEQLLTRSPRRFSTRMRRSVKDNTPDAWPASSRPEKLAGWQIAGLRRADAGLSEPRLLKVLGAPSHADGNLDALALFAPESARPSRPLERQHAIAPYFVAANELAGDHQNNFERAADDLDYYVDSDGDEDNDDNGNNYSLYEFKGANDISDNHEEWEDNEDDGANPDSGSTPAAAYDDAFTRRWPLARIAVLAGRQPHTQRYDEAAMVGTRAVRPTAQFFLTPELVPFVNLGTTYRHHRQQKEAPRATLVAASRIRRTPALVEVPRKGSARSRSDDRSTSRLFTIAALMSQPKQFKSAAGVAM